MLLGGLLDLSFSPIPDLARHQRLGVAESAQDELLSFDGDELLIQIEGELPAAAEWLDTWEQKTGFMDGEEPASVVYRLADMEEDIEQVEEPIEVLANRSCWSGYRSGSLVPKPHTQRCSNLNI